jgi:hypothetical protein
MGCLKDINLRNNKIEQFNLNVSQMPRLKRLQMDWFAYLLPPVNASGLIERIDECENLCTDDVDDFTHLERLMYRQFLDNDGGVSFLHFVKWYGIKSVDEKDNKGRTILHYAAAKGD